jgi:hypothetical protein
MARIPLLELKIIIPYFPKIIFFFLHKDKVPPQVPLVQSFLSLVTLIEETKALFKF